MLDEAAVQIEEQRRAEHREDEPGPMTEESPGDHTAGKRAGEAEPDRGEDPHRIRPRQCQPRERADDQPLEDENQDEPEDHRYCRRLSSRRVRAAVYSSSSRTPVSWSS